MIGKRHQCDGAAGEVDFTAVRKTNNEGGEDGATAAT
jgi:hypothetical protein